MDEQEKQDVKVEDVAGDFAPQSAVELEPTEEETARSKKAGRKPRKPRGEPGLKELPPPAAEAQEEAAVRQARWRVSLVCPTPLAHPTLEVHGANEDEARAEFCKRNGISGSVHVWTVERLS